MATTLDDKKATQDQQKAIEASAEAEGESPAEQAQKETSALANDPSDDESNASDAESPDTNDEPQDPTTTSSTNPATTAALERQARFRALQARQADSRTLNRKETALETQRQTTDPNALSSLHRKRDIALQKLQRADAAEAGEDYERKRAWDWTIDESERWDRRTAKKAKHRADAGFHDYAGEARKTYKRQMKGLAPDLEAYEREKVEAVRRAAEQGGLELVETEDGEVVAIDRDGSFYATADSTGFATNKPEKGRVDALVADLRKAEEVRLRKRRERLNRQDDDGADVTYINDKNKQFNQKLARFYNKYTADIRDSFERGTAI